MTVVFRSSATSLTNDVVVNGEFRISHGAPTTTAGSPQQVYAYNDLNTGTGPLDGTYTLRTGTNGNATATSTTQLSALTGGFLHQTGSDGTTYTTLNDTQTGDVIDYSQPSTGVSFTLTVTGRGGDSASGAEYIFFTVSNIVGGTTFSDLDQATGVPASFTRRAREASVTYPQGTLNAEGVSFTVNSGGVADLVGKYSQIARGDYVDISG